MKKIISLVLSTILLFSVINTTAFAISPSSETEVTENIIQYEDGYYAVIEYDEVKAVSTMSTVEYVTHTATYSLRDSSSTLILTFTLTAKFKVNKGISVTCTSATYSSNVYVSGWSIVSPSASYSGATATATATAKKKVLGITTKSVPISVSLTCDKNGNIV